MTRNWRKDRNDWEKLPTNNRWTIHKVRRDRNGNVTEEFYAEKSFYVFIAVAIAGAVALWWGQTNLDGAVRALVVTLASLVTLYLLVILGAQLVFTRVDRFIRSNIR